MAISVNGLIGKHKNHLANWTSPEDKKNFIKITKQAGVIIMGNNTYQTIGKPLPKRLNIILTKNTQNKKNIPNLLEFTNQNPNEIINNLQQRKFQKVIIGGGPIINSLFLENKLIDEIWLTIEPKIFGQGLNLFKETKIDLNLQLISVEKINDNSLFVKYKIKQYV